MAMSTKMPIRYKTSYYMSTYVFFLNRTEWNWNASDQ